MKITKRILSLVLCVLMVVPSMMFSSSATEIVATTWTGYSTSEYTITGGTIKQNTAQNGGFTAMAASGAVVLDGSVIEVKPEGADIDNDSELEYANEYSIVWTTRPDVRTTAETINTNNGEVPYLAAVKDAAYGEYALLVAPIDSLFIQRDPSLYPNDTTQDGVAHYMGWAVISNGNVWNYGVWALDTPIDFRNSFKIEAMNYYSEDEESFVLGVLINDEEAQFCTGTNTAFDGQDDDLHIDDNSTGCIFTPVVSAGTSDGQLLNNNYTSYGFTIVNADSIVTSEREDFKIFKELNETNLLALMQLVKDGYPVTTLYPKANSWYPDNPIRCQITSYEELKFLADLSRIDQFASITNWKLSLYPGATITLGDDWVPFGAVYHVDDESGKIVIDKVNPMLNLKLTTSDDNGDTDNDNYCTITGTIDMSRFEKTDYPFGGLIMATSNTDKDEGSDKYEIYKTKYDIDITDNSGDFKIGGIVGVLDGTRVSHVIETGEITGSHIAGIAYSCSPEKDCYRISDVKNDAILNAKAGSDGEIIVGGFFGLYNQMTNKNNNFRSSNLFDGKINIDATGATSVVTSATTAYWTNTRNATTNARVRVVNAGWISVKNFDPTVTTDYYFFNTDDLTFNTSDTTNYRATNTYGLLGRTVYTATQDAFYAAYTETSTYVSEVIGATIPFNTAVATASGDDWVEAAYTTDKAVDATCGTYGTVEKTYTEGKQTEPVANVIVSLPNGNHVWGDWETTTEATCGTDGVNTRTCSVCSTTETETIPATGNHTWGDWVVTKPATYTEVGEETRTCSVCSTTETKEIPKVEKIELPFTDVPETAWYRTGVEYCYANGYMSGTTATTFTPNGNLTRAQIVVILAAMRQPMQEFVL